MKTKLLLSFFLFLMTTVSYSQWNQIGQEIKGTNQYQQLGNKTAISGNGNRIVIYSLLTENNYPKGKIQVFDLAQNTWQEIFTIENINDATSNSTSDAKIDISNDGKVIAFSFYKNNEYIVNAYIYSNTTNTFSKYGVDISPRPNDASGIKSSHIRSLSLNETGNTLAIASFYRDENDNDKPYNIVDVYKYENLNWARKGETLRGANFYTDSRGDYQTSMFGNAIDLSGDGNTLLIGEKEFLKDNTYFIGRVSVYNFQNNNWSLLGNQILGTHTADASERLGTSVSISKNGQRIAIGSQGLIDKLESTAKVYKLNNNSWEQVGSNLKVRGSSLSKFDGVSDVSLNQDGSVIALSNTLTRTNALNITGALAVYQFTNAQWLQRSENKIGENHNDGFPGYISVSNNGKKIITSSSYNGDNAEYSGKVFVFENLAVIDKTLNNTNIPDDNFEQALIDLGYDNELDDYVLTENIKNVTELIINNKNISSLKGIEAFTNLKKLNVEGNSLASLDLSMLTTIEELNCSKNQITNLNLQGNNSLTHLNTASNRLNTLKLKDNNQLQTLDLHNNSFEKINITGFVHLETLIIRDNSLTSLDISTNTSLATLSATNNSLDCIQVNNVVDAITRWSANKDAHANFSTDCSDVWTINVDPTILTTLSQIQGLDANNDGSITLAEAAAYIGELDLSNRGITIVDGLQAFTKITTLNLSGNGITDLSPLTGLTIELLSKNSNATRTVSTTPLALENLIISNNNFETLNLESLVNLKTVDISNNQDLVTLSIKNGKNDAITSFISTGTTKLTCILVDNKDAAFLSNWNIDANNSFANSKTDCRQNVLSVDNFLLKSLKIYPNPVKDILNINLSNQVEFSNATIVNITGKVMLKSNKKSININLLSKGIYLLKVETDKGKIIKKIIKF